MQLKKKVFLFFTLLYYRSDGKPLSKNALKKMQKEAEKAAKKAQKKAQAEQQKQTEADDVAKDFYGDMKMIQSSEQPGIKFL